MAAKGSYVEKGAALLFQTDNGDPFLVALEWPVLLLLIVVSAASIAGIVAFVIVGSRVVGAVDRFAFPQGVPPSTAGSSKFNDALLLAAQQRADRISGDNQEIDYVRIWVAGIQPIRPEVLMYRAAFELMARGIATKLIVQAIRKDSVGGVLDPLAPMFVYTTEALCAVARYDEDDLGVFAKRP